MESQEEKRRKIIESFKLGNTPAQEEQEDEGPGLLEKAQEAVGGLFQDPLKKKITRGLEQFRKRGVPPKKQQQQETP